MTDKLTQDFDPVNYAYSRADEPHTFNYLVNPIISLCRTLNVKKVLDLGCGNGALCGILSNEGYEAVGCDPSESGIRIARETYPHIKFIQVVLVIVLTFCKVNNLI